MKSSSDNDNGEESVLEKENVMTLDDLRKNILITCNLANHITQIHLFMEPNLTPGKDRRELMRPCRELQRDRSKMRQPSSILDFFFFETNLQRCSRNIYH